MAPFYANENIPQPVVMDLRRRGHDVLTSLEAGKANASVPDREVLIFATAEDRILLSHNRVHFLRLHQHWAEGHPGMVLCTVDPDFSALAARIHAAVANVPDMRDQTCGIR